MTIAVWSPHRLTQRHQPRALPAQRSITADRIVEFIKPITDREAALRAGLALSRTWMSRRALTRILRNATAWQDSDCTNLSRDIGRTLTALADRGVVEIDSHLDRVHLASARLWHGRPRLPSTTKATTVLHVRSVR